MTAHGYNPEFWNAVQRKRALAQMRRRMREEEERVQALVGAARAAADAILAAAHEEARLIMSRAYREQERPKRPVAAIIAEVAAERGMPAKALRGRAGTRAAREARRDAIRRAAQERKDLSAADLAKIFGRIDPKTVRNIIGAEGGYAPRRRGERRAAG